MRVYKGTDRQMKCRGMQYTLGETAVFDGEPHLCKAGLHACEQPIDVLNHYTPNESRYFEAEAEEVSAERESSDSKIVARKMTLKAEIGVPGLVKAQIEYVKSQIGFDDAIKRANAEKENHATGDRGAASATGYRGAASATGDQGAASATGKPVLLLRLDVNAKQWAHSAARSAASSAASGTEIHIRSLLSRQRLSMAKRSSLILGIGWRTGNLWRWNDGHTHRGDIHTVRMPGVNFLPSRAYRMRYLPAAANL